MYYAFTAYPRAEPEVMATKPHCNCCKISIITLARIGSELPAAQCCISRFFVQKSVPVRKR